MFLATPTWRAQELRRSCPFHTSPAHDGLPFNGKLAAWRSLLAFL